MHTTAATFAARIKTLQEHHSKLLNGIVPVPTGLEIVNSLNPLKQNLQVILKDMPQNILEMTQNYEEDTNRLALFPTMDYKGLFDTLVLLIDDANLIHIGLQEFAQSVFSTIIYLIPFLERDLLSSLPYIAASSFVQFPGDMHRDILNYLIYHILPFAIPSKIIENSQIALSIPSILMSVFQYAEDLKISQHYLSECHCLALECLMALKPNLAKDILNIIAYGPSSTRIAAVKVLFYYWPTFNATLFDRQATASGVEVPSYTCQNKTCVGSNVTKMCYSVAVTLKYSVGSPPPVYLCIECANEIHREHPNQEFHDVLLPVHQENPGLWRQGCEVIFTKWFRHGLVCTSVCCPFTLELKNVFYDITQKMSVNCRATDKIAVSICFSMECTSCNGNRPIRYCQQCHNSKHNSLRGYDHIYHSKLPSAGEMDPVMRSYLFDAAIALLKEVRPATPEIPRDMTDIQAKAAAFSIMYEGQSITLEDRQLAGRCGALLLIGLCMPTPDSPTEIVGRMLSILFNWYRITAYSYDSEESNVEDIKRTTISKKLLEIHNMHFTTYVSCLLPHPANYARVGGHWEMLVSHTSHLKNGLNKIYYLAQYNLITQKVWDSIMPHWLEAVVQDVTEKELPELKIAISKMLDISHNTLSNFDMKKMYHFIAVRFKKTSAKVQGQALSWLQMLTLLDIALPPQMLLSFFDDGIDSLIETEGEYDEFIQQLNLPLRSTISPVVDFYEEIAAGLSDDDSKKIRKHVNHEYYNENELKLQGCVLMLDILLKQLELNRFNYDIDIYSVIAQEMTRLLHKTISASWFMNHVCTASQDCSLCEACTVWHQLATMLIKYICPEDLTYPPDPPFEESSEDSKKSPPDSDKKEQKQDSLSSPFNEMNTVGHIMTATVETTVDSEVAPPIIVAERIMGAIARAVTLPEKELTGGNSRLPRSSVLSEVDSSDLHNSNECEDCAAELWLTSAGKFRFNIEELPPQLQFLYMLLKEVARIENPSVLYSMLQSLYLLILHDDMLSKYSKDHLGFVIWCQENLIIRNLWELCDAEHSQLCEISVPILLHCVTLPSGSDIFWKILQDEFHSNDWRVRFVAVERVTVMARFMDSTPLRNNFTLQSVLTNAFCYLISSMDDLSELVAQRATLYIGTIHDYAMRSLIMCLETQFDSVIVDRPMVLQSLYQLHNSLSDRKILTWDFFLNRFDTLFIEAQIHLEKTGDIPHYRDLRNCDQTNEVFAKKLQRAQEALSQTSDPTLVKTLSASFGTKWPYKRTMSAPASILTRQDSKLEKDKVYNRQFSAPVLKRKSSKFGIDAITQQLANNNEDGNVYATLHRIIALEESDRETTHLLIFLLMQFMSRSDQASPSEDKILSKMQNIVLRHLYLLLGYNQTEGRFFVAPQALRTSTVFNAFLSNLPQLLDQNYKMGCMIVPTTLLLLQYCPCTSHNVGDYQNEPNYTLWYLETHSRRCWIMSFFVLLYKYNYKKPPLSHQVLYLIRIILNTLNAQHHVCHRVPSTMIMSILPQQIHSRDLSQRSFGAETPPQSPGTFAHPSFRPKKSATSMETHWEEDSSIYGKHIHSSHSMEAEDSETMCPNVVQRCKSDSTVPNSLPSHLGHSDEDKHRLSDIYNRKPVWYLGNEEGYSESGPSTSNLSPGDYNPHRLSQRAFELSAMVHQNKSTPRSKDNGSVAGNEEDGKPTDSSTVDANARLSRAGRKQGKDIYGSTESSSFKMDVHPGDTDNLTINKSASSTVELMNSKELTLPAPERLLPVGKSPHRTLDESPATLSVAAANEKQRLHDERRLRELEIGSASCDCKVSHLTDRMDHSCRSRSISPRRLMKQIALESPSDDVFIKSVPQSNETQGQFSRSKKCSNIPSNPHALLSYMQEHGFWGGCPQRGSSIDPVMEHACHASYTQKQCSYRIGEDCTSERCSECGQVIEEYNDDEIGLCIIIIGTFMHREPALAAPILHEILSVVVKLSTIKMYAWQVESNANVPGSSGRVARQFLKVILQQLAPNGVFYHMFRTPIHDSNGINFFKSIVQALTDFKELCPLTPLMMLFEVINNKKSLPIDRLTIILNNVSDYIECILMENSSVTWGPFLAQVEIFFRRVSLIMSTFNSFNPFIKNIICILRIPGVGLFKSILDPFSKILSYGIENFPLNSHLLLEVCFHCNRAFIRERDKLMLTRIVVYEFTQALKSKVVLLEANFVTLINFILQDIGGVLPTSRAVENLLRGDVFDSGIPILNTGAAELMRANFIDALDFVADFHSLTKIKANYKCNLSGLNEDTIGGTLKAGIAQYIALELTRGASRDNRVLSRYFPWFCTAPVVQQTPKEFVDCMGHIRLISWLLVGTLTNNCMCDSLCQSIPQEVSCYIVDHVQVVLKGFPDYAKTSVVHMSSLFYVFMLCQLWTIYLEHLAASHKPNSEPYVLTMSILFDFWGKVTPAILKLISHSKVMADMVSLHFVSVIEALVECKSPSLSKLIPMWRQLLHNDGSQLPGHLLMRFQNCQNNPPPACVTITCNNVNNSILLKWLQRLQFRMGQIELQASQANKFYSV